jgi:hyperosmotically inducible protein
VTYQPHEEIAMFRCVFRLMVVGALLAGGAYMLGYRWDDTAGRRARAAGATARATAAAAADRLAERVDREGIREAGAGLASTIGEQAGRAEAALGEARLVAKIKAKIALDDTIEAEDIDLDTEGSVVTLRGSVASARERQRALQLARETEGVTSVVDRLEVTEP